MRKGLRVAVIIPALNEAKSIGSVIDAIPPWADDVIVGDNGSTDGTPEIAEEHGARVCHAPRRGYGSACLAAMATLKDPDVVVFVDGDFSDYPGQMDRLVDPIALGDADLVIGSRVLGFHEPGALSPQARFGNWLATRLMRLFWGVRYTDLGPFRAIRYATLRRLGMRDPDYGWTVEMQIKAALQGVPAIEAPVDYRRRIGRSKVSGTLRGILGAGYKILGTIFVSALTKRPVELPPEARLRLGVFTRFPVPGETKTRLIPALGPEGAADTQRAMAEHTMATARHIQRRLQLDVEVRHSSGTERQMTAWLGAYTRYTPQGDGDLGDRMMRAFDESFHEGIERVVLIGIDCPDLTDRHLWEAFSALDSNDLVLGPAEDGGYYLIGLREEARGKAIPTLFVEMDWGTESIFGETCTRAERAGLSLHSLESLQDVDRPDDLARWERIENTRRPPWLTVIIPALNEEDRLGDTLSTAKTAPNVEIIVVDGGSRDATVKLAEAHGVHVAESPSGRALQMNEGAKMAQGEVLLFLHADTRLPAQWDLHVQESLARPGTVAGAFRFATNYTTISMRVIAATANLRSKWLAMPYGDQGLFVKKTVFEEMGGFRNVPFMEDYEFVRRLNRQGTITVAPVAATTCGRRWRDNGPWRSMIRNQLCVIAYLAGVSPITLERWYRRPAKKKTPGD